MKYLLVMLGVLSSAPTWAQSSVQVRAILCEEIARVQGNGSPVYTNGLVEDGLPRPQAEAFGQTWMETVRSQCARPFASWRGSMAAAASRPRRVTPGTGRRAPTRARGTSSTWRACATGPRRH